MTDKTPLLLAEVNAVLKEYAEQFRENWCEECGGIFNGCESCKQEGPNAVEEPVRSEPQASERATPSNPSEGEMGNALVDFINAWCDDEGVSDHNARWRLVHRILALSASGQGGKT